MSSLTTLARVRAALGLRPTDAADDPRILAAIRAAGRAIERAAGRSFTPRSAVYAAALTAPGELVLPGDLLSLTSVSDAGGLVPLEEIVLTPAAPPHSLITLTGGRTFAVDPGDQRVVIGGLWGWHDDPEAMWRATGLTLTAAASADTLSLTLATTETADAEGELPAISPGALLRLDGEYVRVVSIPALGKPTVVRGVGGTTALAYAAGIAVFTYQPPADIGQIATAWAARLYADPHASFDDLHARLRPLRREAV